MKVTIIPVVFGAFWYCHQRIDKGTGGLGYKRTSGDHSHEGVIKISLNTEKTSGDLRRHAVAQNQRENYQLSLV